LTFITTGKTNHSKDETICETAPGFYSTKRKRRAPEISRGLTRIDADQSKNIRKGSTHPIDIQTIHFLIRFYSPSSAAADLLLIFFDDVFCSDCSDPRLSALIRG